MQNWNRDKICRCTHRHVQRVGHAAAERALVDEIVIAERLREFGHQCDERAHAEKHVRHQQHSCRKRISAGIGAGRGSSGQHRIQRAESGSNPPRAARATCRERHRCIADHARRHCCRRGIECNTGTIEFIIQARILCRCIRGQCRVQRRSAARSRQRGGGRSRSGRSSACSAAGACCCRLYARQRRRGGEGGHSRAGFAAARHAWSGHGWV